MTPYKQVSPLVPASPFRSGDPPQKHAELTLYALGPDQEEIIPCLRVLGEFNLRELRRFQGSLPVTIALPATYYDRSNTFVRMLRSTGTKFRIVSWPWLCPDEVADDEAGRVKGLHWCTSTCPVAQYREVLTS